MPEQPAPLWLKLELRHLAALKAVARDRSIVVAAASLEIAPTLLGRQLATLENAVGTRLVDRSRGAARVSLTPAGVSMLSHADRIVAQLQLADADVRRAPGASRSVLTLGLHATLSAWIGPTLLSRMREQRPDIDIVLCEASSGAELLARLATGELDMAFAEVPASTGPFVQETIARAPYVVVAPHGSAITRCARGRVLTELAALPLIAPTDGLAAGRIERRLQEDGLSAHWLGRNDAHATIAALVRSCAGFAVLPALAIGPVYGELDTVDLADLLEPGVLTLSWHAERGTPPQLSELREQVRATCEGLISSSGGVAEPAG